MCVIFSSFSCSPLYICIYIAQCSVSLSPPLALSLLTHVCSQVVRVRSVEGAEHGGELHVHLHSDSDGKATVFRAKSAAVLGAWINALRARGWPLDLLPGDGEGGVLPVASDVESGGPQQASADEVALLHVRVSHACLLCLTK